MSTNQFLDPSLTQKGWEHTALLVIDLQCGAFDGVRCSPVDRPEILLGHAASLVEAARTGGNPIIFVQHCEGAGEPFEENTPHGALHRALIQAPGDRIVKKRASSAFEGTDLLPTLESLGVRQLVLCGLQSEFCVFNTAKSALAHGFAVVLAEDAHGTWPSKTESAVNISAGINHQLEESGAILNSTADLVQSLREI